jgi:putative acetyltransferase
MKSVSPPQSKHALDIEGLRSQDITFWTVYENDQLAGCAALKQLDATHGGIKSMRTAPGYRGKGIASGLLKHIITVSSGRGYHKISLETGSMAFFEPARKLYLNHGFQMCRPFAGYKEDPNSVFMSLSLRR